MRQLKLVCTAIVAMCTLLMTTATADASVIKNAKEYKPSSAYKYQIYDNGASQVHSAFTCKKFDSTYTQCFTKDSWYTYRITKSIFAFNAGGDSPISLPYVFPLKKGKTYYETGYSGVHSYTYRYTVMQTNMTKKVSKKTYKHVIKIYENTTKRYVYIAKHRGVILITEPNAYGKQVTAYKIVNYKKK